jgi:hypothetical protein
MKRFIASDDDRALNEGPLRVADATHDVHAGLSEAWLLHCLPVQPAFCEFEPTEAQAQ